MSPAPPIGVLTFVWDNVSTPGGDDVKTLERSAYLEGLYNELRDQFERYFETLTDYHILQGRLEICERTVKATRDHLLSSTGEDIEGSYDDLPKDWAEILRSVRFVGMRASDAILRVLRETEHPMSSEELLDKLNECQFRFRTPTPLREINAAMMRQPHVKREGDLWVYKPRKPRRVRSRSTEAKAKEEQEINVA